MLIRQLARQSTDWRPISFIPHVAHAADGSCVVKMGNTQVMCTGFLIEKAGKPVSVSFSVFEGTKHTYRDSSYAHVNWDSDEIGVQQSIERILVSVLDPKFIDRNFRLVVHCCVLQADGSLTAASIMGSYVACALA